jgi:hypothetical protein
VLLGGKLPVMDDPFNFAPEIPRGEDPGAPFAVLAWLRARSATIWDLGCLAEHVANLGRARAAQVRVLRSTHRAFSFSARLFCPRLLSQTT